MNINYDAMSLEELKKAKEIIFNYQKIKLWKLWENTITALAEYVKVANEIEEADEDTFSFYEDGAFDTSLAISEIDIEASLNETLPGIIYFKSK